MAGWASHRDALDALGVRIVAASADAREDLLPLAEELALSLAWGVTEEDAARFGGWWESRRRFVQPSEFLLRRDATVVNSTYSAGPLGRVAPEEAVRFVQGLRAREQSSQGG